MKDNKFIKFKKKDLISMISFLQTIDNHESVKKAIVSTIHNNFSYEIENLGTIVENTRVILRSLFDREDKQYNCINLITILNGGVWFTRNIIHPLVIDFCNQNYTKKPKINITYLSTSSYVGTQKQKNTSCELAYTTDMDLLSCRDNAINILIDDVYDTGKTIEHCFSYLLNELDVKVDIAIVLAMKAPDNVLPLEIKLDYVVKCNKNEWLYGCGMDLFGYYRSLEQLRAIRP